MHKKSVEEKMYCMAASTFLRELEGEQVRHVLRASLSVATYYKKYPQVGDAFHISFQKKRCDVSLINGAAVLAHCADNSKEGIVSGGPPYLQPERN